MCYNKPSWWFPRGGAQKKKRSVNSQAWNSWLQTRNSHVSHTRDSSYFICIPPGLCIRLLICIRLQLEADCSNSNFILPSLSTILNLINCCFCLDALAEPTAGLFIMGKEQTFFFLVVSPSTGIIVQREVLTQKVYTPAMSVLWNPCAHYNTFQAKMHDLSKKNPRKSANVSLLKYMFQGPTHHLHTIVFKICK